MLKLGSIFIILSLVQLIFPREIQTTVMMQQFKQTNGWIYIGKIVLTEGKMDIKLTTQKTIGQSKIEGTHLFLLMISDQKWEKQRQQKCNHHSPSSILTHELLLSGQISISQAMAVINKSQLYYFVLTDCENKLREEYSNFDLQINLKLDIINNGSFMGEEEDHWFIVPVIIGIGFWIIFSDKYFLRGQFLNDPDYAKMILFMAIAGNASSLIWRSFGYLIYRNFGVNFLLFHLVYLFMHALSQTMVLALLILISTGWSLNFMTGPKFEISIPILCFLMILNIALTLMTQISNSAHDMHHTFDASSGTVLIFLRILIALGFITSIIITYNQSRYRIKHFLQRFGVLGFLYIFSLPMLIYFANGFLAPRFRNQFVFISVQALKSICNISLMYMVSSSRSEYSKLSYRNASFLPTQTGLF